jgi:hypothetical protein
MKIKKNTFLKMIFHLYFGIKKNDFFSLYFETKGVSRFHCLNFENNSGME